MSSGSIRVPNTVLVFGYSLVFLAFVRLMDLSFADLSPVRVEAALDPRLLRFAVIEAEAKGAKVRWHASSSDVRVEANGLRSPGLTLTIEAPMIEAPCPIGRPHTHAADQVAERLEVRLEARSLERSTRLRVGVSEPAPGRAPRRIRWSAPLELAPQWRAYRVPLADMRPPARDDARPGAVASILLRPFPPTHSALGFRNVTLLRVSSASRELRTVE